MRRPSTKELELADSLLEKARGLLADAVELRNAIVALTPQAPDHYRCPSCPMTFKSQNKLEEHVYVQHDGPDPPGWIEAERRAEPV